MTAQAPAEPAQLRQVTFRVVGTPVPQGSMKGYANKRTGRVHLTSDNPNLRSWREMIAWEARQAADWCSDAPVEVRAQFWLLRPKSLPKRVQLPSTKPDCDKLLRGVLDGLTGVLITDDSRVVRATTSKHYCGPDEQPGALITVRELDVPR